MDNSNTDMLAATMQKLQKEISFLNTTTKVLPSDPLQKMLLCVRHEAAPSLEHVSGFNEATLDEYNTMLTMRVTLVQGLLRTCERTFVPLVDQKTRAGKDIVKEFEGVRKEGRRVVKVVQEMLLGPLFLALQVFRDEGKEKLTPRPDKNGPRGRFAVREADDESDSGPGEERQFMMREVVYNDEKEEQERMEQLRSIGRDMQDVRELQEHVSALTLQQQERLTSAEGLVDKAHANTASARGELSTAVKYKILGATLTGAIIGGLIGGPVGALAGASHTATILGSVGVGVVGGAVVSREVAKNVVGSVTTVDEEYAIRLEREKEQ